MPNNKGFSLIEVMVAVTLIALVAVSTLGLLGYHRSAAVRMEDRFSFCNHAVALATEIPFIIKELDEEFPILEKEENMREFEGDSGDLKWQASLSRASMSGIPPFFQLRITIYRGKQKQDLVRYLPAGSEGEGQKAKG